jgi:RNA 2',3'-cyclic 3'-phosphodiesterase
VHEAVNGALGAAHVFEPERRPFWAHVTLARVKRGARAEPLPEEPAAPDEPFTAPELTLYRSTLRPQGAVYDPLARTELAAA